jgi:hypothetical protein
VLLPLWLSACRCGVLTFWLREATNPPTCLETEGSILCSQEPGWVSILCHVNPVLISLWSISILSSCLFLGHWMVLLKLCTPNRSQTVSSIKHNIIISTPVSSAVGRARLAASVALLYVYARVWTVSYSHYESKLHSSMDNTAAALQVRPARDSRLCTTWSKDWSKNADNLCALS